MACATHFHSAHLAQDPTRTKTLRQQLLREIRKRFRRVRGLIRATVGYENDALHLKQDAELADPRESFRRLPPERLADKFEDWLRGVFREEVLEPLPIPQVRQGEHWLARFLRTAYKSGAREARRRVEAEGVSVGDRSVEAFIQLPVSQRQLRQLYQRAYQNLESITDDTAQEIRETLTEGLDAGDNPPGIWRGD